MPSLSKIIQKHRTSVLKKEAAKTKRIQAVLRKQKAKTKIAMSYQKKLAKQKAIQKEQLAISQKLKNIRSAPRKAKIKKLKAISKTVGKQVGRGSVVGYKLIKQGLVTLGDQLEKRDQRMRANSSPKKKQTRRKKRKY